MNQDNIHNEEKINDDTNNNGKQRKRRIALSYCFRQVARLSAVMQLPSVKQDV